MHPLFAINKAWRGQRLSFRAWSTPYVLSIPHYSRELSRLRSPRSFRDWLYFKVPYLFSLAQFPPYVTVEATSECNQGCPHCWRGSSVERRGIGAIGVATFAKVVEEIGIGPLRAQVFKIGGSGEPALHERFGDLMATLEKLRGRGTHTILYSNGTVFERFSFEKITNWNVDRIVVSIDGIDAKSYERIRIGGNYATIRKNVLAF